MQPACHRDSHTHPHSAQTQHTTSIATKSAPYTRHITTSALALAYIYICAWHGFRSQEICVTWRKQQRPGIAKIDKTTAQTKQLEDMPSTVLGSIMSYYVILASGSFQILVVALPCFWTKSCLDQECQPVRVFAITCSLSCHMCCQYSVHWQMLCW